MPVHPTEHGEHLPSNGCRRRVTRTEAGNASRRVVCRGFVRADPHSGLMQRSRNVSSHRRLLALLRAFLRAGVMEQGSLRRPVTGTPQGGVICPLMANLYLHRLTGHGMTGYW